MDTTLTDDDAILKACGMLAEAHIVAPYVVLAHARVLTILGLLKDPDDREQ